MASTSPGYGITIRIEGSASSQPVALATTIITTAGATITALDIVESHLEKVVIDVTCDTIDSDHAEKIAIAIAKNPELTVRKVSDRTFLLHLGGKIEIASRSHSRPAMISLGPIPPASPAYAKQSSMTQPMPVA